MRLGRLQLLAVSVLLVAGILRFSALGRQGVWDDESFTLRALGIIAEPMTMAEGAPLYFLFLHGWVTIVGTGLAAVRAFSALWGTAGVALIGLFTGRAISPRAGLFSAAVLSLHPFHLAYSQEARPYAMVFALQRSRSGWLGKSVSGSSLSPQLPCCGLILGECSSGWYQPPC